jgi:phage FluMu gp28-like protein
MARAKKLAASAVAAAAVATTAKTDGVSAPTSPRDLMLGYQRRWADDSARFKIGLMARQTGKDFSSGEEGIADCFKHEAAGTKVDWLITAPSERQSLESFGKWRQWADAFGLAIADVFESRIEDIRPDLKSSTMVFPGGSRVIAVPGRPDTVRGFSANVLATEFAFFEDPDATWRALYPSISNPLRGGLKMVRLISTPNGRGNKFEEIWTRNFGKTDADVARQVQSIIPDAIRAKIEAAVAAAPKRSGARLGMNEAQMRWACHRVDIYDAVRDGLPVNIAELYAGMNDPEGWAQEFELEFLDAASVLLGYDVIALCEAAEATEDLPFEFWQTPSALPVDLGIDFGRKRDLTVCWALETAGDLALTKEVFTMQNAPAPQQVEALAPRCAKARRVSVDNTGLGVTIADYLIEKFGEWKPEENKFGKIERVNFTQQNKVELYGGLAMAMQQTRIKVPKSRTIREDLHSIYRVALSGGGVTYRAPHTADGHADRCAALALANRARGTQNVTLYAEVC